MKMKYHLYLLLCMGLASFSLMSQERSIEFNLTQLNGSSQSQEIDINSILPEDIDLDIETLSTSKNGFANFSILLNYKTKLPTYYLNVGIGIGIFNSKSNDIDYINKSQNTFELVNTNRKINFQLLAMKKNNFNSPLHLTYGFGLFSEFRYRNSLIYTNKLFDESGSLVDSRLTSYSDSGLLKIGPTLNIGFEMEILDRFFVGLMNSYWLNYSFGDNVRRIEKIHKNMSNFIDTNISYNILKEGSSYGQQNRIFLTLSYILAK